MEAKKSSQRTMFMSVLMSAPGPLIVGAGLLVGRSSTQLADFIRRSAELLALIVAFVTYQRTNRPSVTEDRKKLLERRSNLFVGGAMCLGGAAMLLIALLSSGSEYGNVIPGLAVALLGVIANTIFWFRYKKLGTVQNNAILLVQSRLYRAKSLVDICVTAALCVVLLAPGSAAAPWIDRIGSAVVALYLVWCGLKTLLENK